MKRPERVSDYLDHIAEAAIRVGAYLQGVDLAMFQEDMRTQDAVVRNLEIIGEAATQMMDQYAAFVAAHPEVPWQAMRGMRNRMAHGYFDTNLEIVWDTVQQDVPALRQQMHDLLQHLQKLQQEQDRGFDQGISR